MIERIIENWLTNTNERGYEIPFCQYLISNGYTVLHLSSHGPMEQGKDIIATDPNGYPCAFQLKAGNIDGNIWRRIKGEIDELIEIPINYPKIRKDIPHRAAFVTNGTISDKVRRDVDDRNYRLRQMGLPELEIVNGFELIKRFIDVHGNFLPTQPSDFKLFLELFLSDGRELLNKKMFTEFLESIFSTDTKKELELKRKIASNVLLTQYVIQPYDSTVNHVSIIEGWIIFCSYLLGLIEKYSLSEEYWRQSYDIILQRINSQMKLLKTEFFSRKDLKEGDLDGGEFYRSRITMILGWLSAFELFQKRVKSEYEIDIRVYESIKEHYSKNTWFWGESSTPLFIMMSLLTHEHGDEILSNNIILDLIIKITSENNIEDGEGIPDPYISPNEIISYLYKLRDAEIDMSSFLGSSYHLEPLVDILVRRDKRNSINELWKYISRFQNRGFKPEHPWMYFQWHCDKGEEYSRYYNATQSWKELREKATASDDSMLPSILVKNPQFAYYFLPCYPHRLNGYTIKLIDMS